MKKITEQEVRLQLLENDVEQLFKIIKQQHRNMKNDKLFCWQCGQEVSINECKKLIYAKCVIRYCKFCNADIKIETK